MKQVLLLIGCCLGLCCAYAQAVQPVDSEQLFTCFRQGNRGNCVSIGFIKAAINVFGINGVFEEKPINDTTTQVILKNGQRYTLTQSEFYLADTIMHLRKTKSGMDTVIRKYATRCFAIMAKVRQIQKNAASFYEAAERLSKSASASKIAPTLGLENYVIALNYEDFGNNCGILAWRKKHALYVCNGYMDDHGKKLPVTDEYYKGLMIVSTPQ
jgi:hypothetical protein